MRLFTAILFSEQVTQQLLHAQDLLRAHGSGNFTRPENLHLTLAFIGETQRHQAALEAIKQIRSQPFVLELSVIGSFGELYWAGAKNSSPLAQLQQDVIDTLSAQSFSFEARSFVPHVTLCRKYQPQANFNLKDVEDRLSQICCPVNSISLMESTHYDGQLVYRERFRQSLR